MRLIARELGCVRGERRLFRGLSFELKPGEAIAVLGPNGAGKSSLLRIVAGLLPPDEGVVAIESGERVAESCHFVGHLDAVKSALTVSENLNFAHALMGGRAGTNDAVLARLGLAGLKDLPAYTLSAGQRRRLALARLLAAPRPIWLLDEPTASLDTGGQELLAGMIAEHRKEGGSVIAATHLELDLEEAREIFISNGSAV